MSQSMKAILVLWFLVPKLFHLNSHPKASTVLLRLCGSGTRLSFKIETIEQMGDMFTKGIPRATFEHICSNIMEW